MDVFGTILGGGLGGGGGEKFGLGAYGVNKLSSDTLKLYQMLSSSPQFQSMLQGNAISANQLTSALNSGLASRGLSTSGIGTVASALGGQAQAFGDVNLRGGLFGQAQQNALQLLIQRLQAYTALKGQQQQQPGLLSQVAGAGLGAFGTGFLTPFFQGMAPKPAGG